MTNYQQELMDEMEGLPDEAIPNLLQIVRLFKESILVQRHQAVEELREEFAQWESLSNEALHEFEKGLS